MKGILENDYPHYQVIMNTYFHNLPIHWPYQVCPALRLTDTYRSIPPQGLSIRPLTTGLHAEWYPACGWAGQLQHGLPDESDWARSAVTLPAGFGFAAHESAYFLRPWGLNISSIYPYQSIKSPTHV